MERVPYRYRMLALLSLASALIAYAGRGYWAVDAFAANIAAGFIGALATVILVDRAAERRQEENHRRVERVALRQARLPIVHLSELFADMIKASSPKRPDPIPNTWRG